jgi:glycosyltransferase involved in cell wall biosynthesis
VDAPVFFSPNGSRAIMRLRGLGLPVVLWAARPLLRPRRHAAAQVRLPAATPRWAPEVPVEAPIHQAFFRIPRSEARRPLIVTGGRLQGPGNAELTAQLAVLLNDEDLGIGFNWIGAVDEVSRTRLNAAGVGVFEVRNEADCAARLGAGWIYLAPGSPRGFAQCLVEAMAAGLPCVALDSEAHRELIRDGESGFLCQTERDMLNRIAALIDDPALRERIGRAARHEACGRFGESQFGAKLLAAYALDV